MIENVDQLEEHLSRPDDRVGDVLARLGGDLVVLGAGGKLGPTLCRMARRARPAGDVIGVSRFSEPDVRERLEAHDVRTVACDLLDPSAVRALPEAAAVVFLVGRKFGTRGAEATTWAVNAHLPRLTAARYAGVPTVVLSSGNVYPFVDVAASAGAGATEATPPAPVGAYAWSVLARERVFEHCARRDGTNVAILRLNYATELRYGVLVDVAKRVAARRSIDLSTGHVNVIWQRDANAVVLRSIELASSPPRILNVTGPDRVSIRALAARFGELLGAEPVLVGVESDTALLSDASRMVDQFGAPATTLEQMVEWTAQWVGAGRPTHGKPTHFEVRDGAF